MNIAASSAEGSTAGCVTGRFQPLHLSHLELFQHVLARHGRLIVAITNPDASTRVRVDTNEGRHLQSENPFTFYERLRFVRAALGSAGVPPERYDVVPFPLHHPPLWSDYVPMGTRQYVRVYSEWEASKGDRLREHGYPVVVLEGAGKEHEATGIRDAIREGKPWRDGVPPAVAALIDEFLQERPLERRMHP